MIKGQVISGEFGKILIRQKSNQQLELGELLICENGNEKILMQVFDLIYGSQISQSNLELISGLKLEEDSDMEFLDPKLRNYNLALLKNIVTIDGSRARVSKNLPKFFSEIREIKNEDLNFLTRPSNPLFLGKIRSGSKILDADIFLDGREVFAHHILIAATTGKGKSLDENEEVLIKKNNILLIKAIGEIVNNSSSFRDSEVLSINPEDYSSEFKKISKFVRHKAPQFMYKVATESGREIMVTGDHNLYVLRKGKLMLLKTQEIKNDDYLPLPLRIDSQGNLDELNLFELLKKESKIYVFYNENIVNKLKSKKECLKILSKYSTRPLQKYDDFVIKKNRIKITLLNELLKTNLSHKDLKQIKLSDLHGSIVLRAIYSITKEFLQLIGYYVAEGYCLNDNSFRISCSERKIRNHIQQILKKTGLNYFLIKKRSKNVDVGISSSIFTKIFKKLEIGDVSGNKRLPNFFMNLSNNNLRILLRTYFEGDGGVDKLIKKEDKNFKISSTTKSKKLASDLCFALYRYGILGRCKKRIWKATNTNNKSGWYYRVSISGKSNLTTFLSKIGFQFQRKNLILKDKFDYKENTNVDVIPINPADFKIRRLKTKLSQKQFSLELNCSQQIISLIESGKRRPSRDLFCKILSRFNSFKDSSYLKRFRWDKIKEIKKIKYNKKYVYDLTIKDNKTFLAGHGGIFVHNSNLTSCMLWDSIDKDYCGILVLDPHDEYYGRNKLGLKNHQNKENVVYYSLSPPSGERTLKINIKNIRPGHFNGVVGWSMPQKEALNAYYKKFGNRWIESIVLEKPLDVKFNEATLAVVKRRLLSLLNLEFDGTHLHCNGIFDISAGLTTISDIVKELEDSNIVIIDTSNFSGAVEILIGSLIAAEILRKYKRYKITGKLKEKPVISIIIEEAPRVLGKEVLEKGTNIFETIAREGRKFKIGLTAITQLPSLIPRQILANMNTKIILGLDMALERQAIIESASQDLNSDSRTMASLDKGEAIISSNFAPFAIPIKIPLFSDLAKKQKKENIQHDFSGVKI